MGKRYTTNFLEDTNGSTGTTNQVLVSTATGIDWVDGSGSGIIGGPYLPLTGGILSGTLTMDDSDILFEHSDGSNYYRIGIGASANFEIYNTNYGRTDLLITQSTGDATFAGDITTGTTSDTVDRYIKVLSGDTKQASLEAYGNSQGTGVVYVGQSIAYGGGIVYNGDGSPAFGNVTTDTISFYRREAGTNSEVFRYGYGGATVTFVGNVVVQGTGANNTTFSTTANQLKLTNSYSTGASGMTFYSSNDTWMSTFYATGSDYGYLDGEYAAWDLRKDKGGGLYLNDNTTYFVQPEGTSNMNAATFAGAVTIDSSTATLNIKGSNTGASLINFADAADGNVGRIYYSHTDNSMAFKANDLTRFTIDSSGDSTFSAQAFSAATSSGDGSSTLTTKGYVDGLITGATIYRGAWDPSGGGYGSPDLSGVTQTSGYYYICSAAGTAEPNGTGTEPDSWAVGDWVIYNDVSGTGQWQKIDNSSVLSGVGTGQTVALWEGAGSVTDSETLGNAPITVSGNDTTFAGTITGTRGFFNSGTTNVVATFTSTDGIAGIGLIDSTGSVELSASGNLFQVQPAGGVAQLTVGATTSTFAGDVIIPTTKALYFDGGGGTYIYESADGVMDFYCDTKQLLTLKQNGTQNEVVVNEGSIDVDFRVESNNDTAALFVQGSDGNVGIGETNPVDKLEVAGGIISANSRVDVGERYPIGHYTPGETIFEIDPTWTTGQLQSYFNSPNVAWTSDADAPGGYAITITGQTGVGGVYGSGFPYMPVDNDGVYYVECYIKNVGTGQTHYMGGNEFDKDFVNTGGNPGSYAYFVMSNTNPGNTWTKVTGYIGGFHASTTGKFELLTKYWTPMALFNWGAGTGTRACVISGWKVVRADSPGDRYFDGKVGIGTDDPDNILHVRAGDTTYASQVGADTMLMLETTNVSNSLQFTSTTTGNQYIMFGDDDPNAGWISYAHSDNNLNFRTAGTERMRIDSAGNVGIGTTAPNARLTVWDANQTFDARTSGINVHRPNSYGQYGSFSYDGAATHFASTYSGNGALGYGTFVFKQYNNGSTGRNALEIQNDGNFLFNQYAGSALTGTPTYLLGTDASGNVVKTNTVPGSAAGPYLPLTGGTLTGNLTVQGKVKAKGFFSHIGTYTANTYTNDWQKVYSHNWSTFSYSAFTIKVLAGGNTSNNNLNADVHISYKMQNGQYRVYANIVNYGAEALLAENFKINLSITSAASGSWTIWHKLITTYQTPFYTLIGSGIDGTWYSETPVASPTGDDDTWTERIILNSMSVDVDNSANVGIGTTAPTSLLEISKQLSAASTIDYPYTISSRDDGNSINQAGGEGVGIKFRIAGNAATTPGDSLVGASIAAIRESASDTDSSTGLGFFVTQNDETLDEALRIDHDGNVGIGQDTPVDSLDVYRATGDASIRIQAETTSDSSILKFRNSNADADITVDRTTSNKARMVFTTDNTGGYVPVLSLEDNKDTLMYGNVGIGTTSPTSKLHSVITTAGDSALKLQDDTGSVFDFQCGIAGVTGDALVIKDTTLSYDYLTLRSGNVGIGVTAPTQKLHIQGAANDGVAIMGVGTTATRGFLGLDSSNHGYLSVVSSASGGGALVKSIGISYFNGGNVGIGLTAPASKMHIAASGNLAIPTLASSLGTATSIALGNAGSTVVLAAGVSNTNVSWLQGRQDTGTGSAFDIALNPLGGNVGIGVTAPSAKLDIVGDGTNYALEVNNTSTGDAIKINTANATGNNGIYWNQGAVNLFNLFSTTSNDTRLRLGNTAGTKVHLSTNGASYLTGGGVGIATTSPGTAYSLVVATIVGQTGSIEGQGSMKVTSGALGVGVTPSGTAGRIDASNDIVAYSSSDERLKENITPITDATEKVKKLTGIEFDWKEECKDAHGHEGHDTGVIAQQVLEVMPTAVRENDNGYLAVRYEKLIGLLIESNKELAARTERLEGLVELMLK